jgi:methylphosphotriester-DNA--protein-cysteine methyltransferase
MAAVERVCVTPALCLAESLHRQHRMVTGHVFGPGRQHRRYAVGLSRSALHERFVQYLGQPPMQYLANWRIQLGARLLRESSHMVARIALEVGYDSEVAFARAFK